jgi:hypothetical protein
MSEIKCFVFTEVLDSSQLPNILKEALYKERSSYRRSIAASEIKNDFYKKASEITKEKINYFGIDENGDFSEEPLEIDIMTFDSESWRYFFSPKSLEELNEMISFIDLETVVSSFNPNLDDDLNEIKRQQLENSIGIPLPEEKFMILKILDSFLLDKMEIDDTLENQDED